MEKQYKAVGRRKAAVARVYINKGTGNVSVNKKDYKDYFPIAYFQNQVELPLKTIEAIDAFDILINVYGGGVKGQAEAIQLGIARALCEVDAEAYRPLLKKAGLLTRDARVVERKKYGKAGARKSFQFSKR